jgi:hypothetical protein
LVEVKKQVWTVVCSIFGQTGETVLPVIIEERTRARYLDHWSGRSMNDTWRVGMKHLWLLMYFTHTQEHDGLLWFATWNYVKKSYGQV